jgi:polar amino acid transport system substrate-binding protein
MNIRHIALLLAVAACACAVTGCAKRERITELAQLQDKEFAVPTGTMADKLVLSRFPKARFRYYDSVLDSAMAVQAGEVDAAAYDEPILRNIAAKNPGLKVLPDKITTDYYGYAVRLGDQALKGAIDGIIREMKDSGQYREMVQRWLPANGRPQPMPSLPAGTDGVLRFGTAAVTEPFSFVDGSQQIVGLDIEMASRVAARLNKKLEIVNMDFGAMIPALIAGKVDMIGSCITISEERAKTVLFSVPYYTGGISALVKE